MDPFETFQYAGCTIKIYHDEDASSPADWDTLGTLYDFTADYVGMERASGNAREMMERRGVRGMLRYLSLCEGMHAVPYDVYEHGMMTIRAASVDDDTCDGYIGATADSIDATGVAPEHVLEALRGEIDTWRAYFEGNVVGYVVEDASGEHVGSCWGFYPDDSPREPTADASAAYVVAWEMMPSYAREHVEALAEAIAEAESYRDTSRKAATESDTFGTATITGDGVTIDATGAQLYAWAHRPGSAWPCSALASLDKIRAAFDANGLLELEAAEDGEDVEAEDLTADELSAWSSDVLRNVLAPTHPAYVVTVGQFLAKPNLTCPECGQDVWDVPQGSKLAKCWNAAGHASGGTLAFDTMEEDASD